MIVNRINFGRIVAVATVAAVTLAITVLSVSARPNLPQTSAPDVTTIRVGDSVRVADAKRIGINVGKPEQYGAGNYLKNVIFNPGFEAGEMGMIFHVEAGATGQRVQHDVWNTNWNSAVAGQPVGFWQGADYEVLYGVATGRSGTVEAFTHENDLYTFYLDEDGAAPEAGDVVAVHQQIDGFAFVADSFAELDDGTIRPNSPGQTSLKLLPPSASWKPSHRYFMDSWQREDETAGRLFPMEGPWQLEIWAKAEDAGEQLEVYFWRETETMFVRELIPLTTDWQLYTMTFTATAGIDSGLQRTVARRDFGDFVWPYPPNQRAMVDQPVLELGFRIGQSAADVWIDDVALFRTDQENPTAFNDKFVAVLKELQPGILRDWGSQLGSSLDNQLAEPWARRPTEFSPKETVAKDYHYSLHEFLELAQEVGAEPWYVIPPTFTPTELENLVAYLSAEINTHPYANKRADLGQRQAWTSVFSTIHLEFANEAWGSNEGDDQFLGASLRGGVRLGTVAHNRFGVMRSSPYFEDNVFNLVIGGQYGDDFRQYEIESNSSNHNSIALAPYVGNRQSLTSIATDEEIYYPAYARLFQDLGSGAVRSSQFYLDQIDQGTELSIYEFNFHTTFDDTPIETRNDFVTGLNGGLTLPLYMLTYQYQLGIRNQVAFQALQYSININSYPDDPEYVRLWGMLRDLEATGRKRPTWLGVELANRAIRGDMLTIEQAGNNPTFVQPPLNEVRNTIEMPFVHAFAFADGAKRSMVLFNLHLTATQAVSIEFGSSVLPTAMAHTLTADSIHDDNEDAEMIEIVSAEINNLTPNYTMQLAPNSMVLLEWERGYSGPQAAPDEFIVGGDAIYTSYDGVLVNDTLPLTGVVTATLALTPTNGTIDFSADGTFVYTPTKSYLGSDYFIYVVDDGTQESNVGLVLIRVRAKNYLPLLSGEQP